MSRTEFVFCFSVIALALSWIVVMCCIDANPRKEAEIRYKTGGFMSWITVIKRQGEDYAYAHCFQTSSYLLVETKLKIGETSQAINTLFSNPIDPVERDDDRAEHILKTVRDRLKEMLKCKADEAKPWTSLFTKEDFLSDQWHVMADLTLSPLEERILEESEVE